MADQTGRMSGLQILCLLQAGLTAVAQGLLHRLREVIRSLVLAQMVICLETTCGLGTTGRRRVGPEPLSDLLQ